MLIGIIQNKTIHKNNMTQEEIDLLLSLLRKANEEGCIRIYDENENFYEPSWAFAYNDRVMLKIKEF